MKLQMNGDKTGIVVISRQCLDRYRDDIRIIDGNDIILPKQQVRILGWLFNCRLSYDSTIAQIIGIVNSRIHRLTPIARIMTEKQRTIAINAFMLSKVRYGMPLFVGETEIIKSSIHRIIMSLARLCKGSYCFRTNINAICGSIGWSNPRQMIIKETAIMMHKILTKQKPEQIFSYIRPPRTRARAKLGKNFETKTKICKRTFINQGIQVYNSLPENLKALNLKQFKREIKKSYIHYIPE